MKKRRIFIIGLIVLLLACPSCMIYITVKQQDGYKKRVADNTNEYMLQFLTMAVESKTDPDYKPLNFNGLDEKSQEAATATMNEIFKTVLDMEQDDDGFGGHGSAGSSPRARGTDRDAEGDVFGQRFIPACAGNSSQTKFTSSACPVHPRVRGEQAGRFSGVRPVAGSSPRARGTAGHLQRRRRQHRFIPACAGNRAPSSTRSAPAPVHPRVRGEQPPASSYGSL